MSDGGSDSSDSSSSTPSYYSVGYSGYGPGYTAGSNVPSSSGSSSSSSGSSGGSFWGGINTTGVATTPVGVVKPAVDSGAGTVNNQNPTNVSGTPDNTPAPPSGSGKSWAEEHPILNSVVKFGVIGLLTTLGIPPAISALGYTAAQKWFSENGNSLADPGAAGAAIEAAKPVGASNGAPSAGWATPEQTAAASAAAKPATATASAPTASATSPMDALAQQQASLGLEQATRAREQYDAAKTRQTQLDSTYDQILSNTLASQKTATDRSASMWDNYVNEFMPVQNKLASTALNYDTAGRRDEAGAAARASVETEAAAQRLAQERNLNRAGVSISSGHGLALDNATRLATTKASTGAATAARQGIEDRGLSLLKDASSLGTTVANGAGANAGQALQADSLAGSTAGNKQQGYNLTLAPAASLYAGATSSTGQAANTLGTLAGLQQRNDQFNANRQDANDAADNAAWGTIADLATRWLGDTTQP